jgi:hypothetical protein
MLQGSEHALQNHCSSPGLVTLLVELPIRAPWALWCCCSVALADFVDVGICVSVRRLARAAMLPACILQYQSTFVACQHGLASAARGQVKRARRWASRSTWAELGQRCGELMNRRSSLRSSETSCTPSSPRLLQQGRVNADGLLPSALFFDWINEFLVAKGGVAGSVNICSTTRYNMLCHHWAPCSQQDAFW